MNINDADGVQAVRQRLRHAADRSGQIDPAIRIESLASRDNSSDRLDLHVGFTVVSGLGHSALQALEATIEGLASRPHGGALSCMARIDGVSFSIEPSGPDHTIDDTRTRDWPTGHHLHDVSAASSESESLTELIDTLTSSIALTSAELRGATVRIQDLRALQGPVGAALDGPEQVELTEALDAMADVLPDPGTIAELRRTLARTDTAGEVDNISEHLVELLAGLGVDNSIDAARATASQIVDEAAELKAVKLRIEAKLLHATSVEAAADAGEIRENLARTELFRQGFRRDLNAKKHMLAAARQQLGFAMRSPTSPGQPQLGVAVPTDPHGRPVPLLLVEPLAGIPIGLGATLLSVLLRLSETTQILCASDVRDLEAWCGSVGDRAKHVAAQGWFTLRGAEG